MTMIECPRCRRDIPADRVDATVPPGCARCAKCGHVFAAAEAVRFDPYHTWLGIPPQEQPPTHYRLLGLSPFESNASVIDHAADGRMAHLRALTTGPRAAQAVSLLNQVAAARICLLDAAKRAAYDVELGRQNARTDQLPTSPVIPPQRAPAAKQPSPAAADNAGPPMPAPSMPGPPATSADAPGLISSLQGYPNDRTRPAAVNRRRTRQAPPRNTSGAAIAMSIFGGACGILFGYLLLYEYIPRVVSQQTRVSSSHVEAKPVPAPSLEPHDPRTPRKSDIPGSPTPKRTSSPRKEPGRQPLPSDESHDGPDLAIDKLPVRLDTRANSPPRPQAALVPPLTFALNQPTVDRVFNVPGMHKGDKNSLEVTRIEGLNPAVRLNASNSSVAIGGTLVIKVESVPSAELRIDTTGSSDGVIGVGVRMVVGNGNSTVPILLTREILDKEIVRLRKRVVDIRQDLAKDEQQQERLDSQMQRRNKTVGPDDRQVALRGSLKKITDSITDKRNELKQLKAEGEATLSLAEDIAALREVKVQFKITAASPDGRSIDLVVSRS